MKLNLNKSTVFANRWRCGAVLLASLCLVWVAFISSSAQMKAQQHVTSVVMGQAAEGARVTISSDSALNDYEAFRRGDRFYVKIPLAEFTSSQPRFHGDGFDDVQVQKVGDSVVVSFRLQPGASARVDQHSTRLEVIFTAPNKIQRGGNVSIASNRLAPTGINRSSVSQANQDRQRDVAGPVPSDGSQLSRERFANGRRSEVDGTEPQPARNTRASANQGQTNSSNNSSVAKPTPVSVASPAAAQNYSAPSSYSPPTTTNTPVSPTGYKPAGVSATPHGGNQSSSTLSQWLSANRNAWLLGTLVLAGLLVLLAAVLHRRRTTKVSATSAKRPLTQPKSESKVELDVASPARQASEPDDTSRFLEALQKSDENRVAPKPAFAPPAGIAASHAAVLSKSSIGSPVGAERESAREEREVFEL